MKLRKADTSIDRRVAKDVARSLALPVADADYYLNAWVQWSLLLRRGDDSPWLKPEQGAVLEMLHQGRLNPRKGAFVSIGVGGGKTLTAMLASTVVGARRPVLLLPPGLDQAFDKQFDIWCQTYKVARPTIFTYSQLSSPSTPTLLDDFRPDFLICDEAHNLKRRESARTTRFLRYLRDFPDTRVMVMSGTMSTGSLVDYAHLLYATLREDAPGPQTLGDIQTWANIVDNDKEALPEQMRAARPLLVWSGEQDYKKAFAKRVAATPGVLMGKRRSVDASILIRRLRGDVPDAVKLALTGVNSRWEYPDGELITEASAKVAAERQMASGFWYKLSDPPSEEWAWAKADWERELRTILAYRSRKGFDSPKLVEDELRRNDWHGYDAARRALFEWDKHRHLKRAKSETVWLEGGKKWLLATVDEWARQRAGAKGPCGARGGGLIWVEHDAVAAALQDAGWDVRLAGGVPPDGTEGRTVVLKWGRYKEGFNLQFDNKALIVDIMPSGDGWDQCIGRQHREGQKADTVYVDVLQHTWRQRQDLDRAIANAEDIHDDLAGMPHRLLLADYAWV